MAKINQVNIFSDALVQTEMENIYNGFQKIGFGTEFAQRCENIDGFLVEVTAVASAEVSASHNLKRVPIGFISIGSSVSGQLYNGTTANTESTVYYKSTANGVFKICLI